MLTRHSQSWLAAVALALGLVLAAPASVRAGFEEGATAYQQGDYAKALQEWTPVAESGNPQAQYNIGYMHFNGIGVPKEPSQAAQWFIMAAEQGDAAAQMSLGVMYGTGQGVPQDFSQAYIWLTLAAARLPYGEYRDQAVKNRDIISAKMSRPQITEALGQALNWTPSTASGGGTQAVVASVPPAITAAGPPASAAPALEPAGGANADPGAQIAAANGTPAIAPPAPKPAAMSAPDAEMAAAKAAEAEVVAQIKAEAEAEAKAAEAEKAAAGAAAAAEAAAAAAAKMAAPPTQTAALTAGTGFLVQLASVRSVSAAESEWARLKSRHADLLGGLEPVLQSVDLGSKGSYVRVHVGPFAGVQEAGEICRALRAQKQDCVVVNTAGRV